MAASSATSCLSRRMYRYRLQCLYIGDYLRNINGKDAVGRRSRLLYRGCASVTEGRSIDDRQQAFDLSSSTSTFETMLREKRRRSRNSVLVHVCSKNLVNKLHDHCQEYGTVELTSHYTLGSGKDFVLVEFDNENSVSELMKSTNHFSNSNVIPMHSRYLWYNETDNADKTQIQVESLPSPSSSTSEQMVNAKSVSEQMVLLHDASRLTDLGQQLRFFVCQQLELAFKGLFSDSIVLPFGSSVNGFGKFDGDLDMILTFDNSEKFQENKNSPFFFHTKRSLTNGRIQMQRYLEIFGDMIGSFFPGCCGVQRILNARVPIVKFQQELVNVECDLTMYNLSGVYMSELLYLYGESDVRVRPLVFAVLRWAKVNGLTHENPGPWITNFTLIVMVVVFLQCRPKPILPSLSDLQRLAGSSDYRVSEDIDCSFLRDISKFPKYKNHEDLGDLLMEFFAFYANFNFKSHGLSLITGGHVVKRDSSPLYVQNPLEIELNISKNVRGEEVTRLSDCLKTAIFTMETSSLSRTKIKDDKWGIVRLLDTKNSSEQLLKNKKFMVGSLLNNKSSETPKTNRSMAARDIFETTSAGIKLASVNVPKIKGDSNKNYMSGMDIVDKLQVENFLKNATGKSRKVQGSKRRTRIKPINWTF